MTSVYYTVNSGLYFSNAETGIFIDGLHGGTDVGFSPVHPETVAEAAARSGIFRDLKALLFTHCHSDHFDPAAVEEVGRGKISRAFEKAAQTEPSPAPAFVYAPEMPLSRRDPDASIRSAGPDGPLRIRVGGLTIFAVKTTHDGGKPLCFTPHVSFVINTPEESFFAAGDAVFTEGSAEKIRNLCTHPVKAAFVNPYQLLLASDREFLAELAPECNVLIHLPKPEDDTYNAKLLYDNAIKKYPEQMPRLLLPGFYSQVF